MAFLASQRNRKLKKDGKYIEDHEKNIEVERERFSEEVERELKN
jgi:hypothetical protein